MQDTGPSAWPLHSLRDSRPFFTLLCWLVIVQCHGLVSPSHREGLHLWCHRSCAMLSCTFKQRCWVFAELLRRQYLHIIHQVATDQQLTPHTFAQLLVWLAALLVEVRGCPNGIFCPCVRWEMGLARTTKLSARRRRRRRRHFPQC